MSTKNKKFSDLDPNSTKFLPLVHTQNGDFIFHPGFIYQSLLKETEISKINAKKVTENVVRFLKTINLKLLTASLIREIVNVHLIKEGFEKERLQYTTIGLPIYDLNKVFDTQTNSKGVISEIINWIMNEFHDVSNLINTSTKDKILIEKV